MSLFIYFYRLTLLQTISHYQTSPLPDCRIYLTVQHPSCKLYTKLQFTPVSKFTTDHRAYLGAYFSIQLQYKVLQNVQRLSPSIFLLTSSWVASICSSQMWIFHKSKFTLRTQHSHGVYIPDNKDVMSFTHFYEYAIKYQEFLREEWVPNARFITKSSYRKPKNISPCGTRLVDPKVLQTKYRILLDYTATNRKQAVVATDSALRSD